MFKEMVSKDVRIYEGEKKQPAAASGVRYQRGQGLTRRALKKKKKKKGKPLYVS